jgi:hypothetical protein
VDFGSWYGKAFGWRVITRTLCCLILVNCFFYFNLPRLSFCKGGFVARGDSIIITLFLPLWINKVFIDRGLCPDGPSTSNSSDELTGDPALHRCDDAFKQAFIYSGIAQTCALLGAPIFGLISHRIRRRSIPFLIASLVIAFFQFFHSVMLFK